MVKGVDLPALTKELREFVDSLPFGPFRATLFLLKSHLREKREQLRWERNKTMPLSECLLPEKLIQSLQLAEPPVTTLLQLASLGPAGMMKIENLDAKNLQSLQVLLKQHGYTAG